MKTKEIEVLDVEYKRTPNAIDVIYHTKDGQRIDVKTFANIISRWQINVVGTIKCAPTSLDHFLSLAKRGLLREVISLEVEDKQNGSKPRIHSYTLYDPATEEYFRYTTRDKNGNPAKRFEKIE